MTNVENILQKKGRDVWSVRSDVSVLDALKMMAEKNVGALLVIDGPSLNGVFSERDYARKSIRGADPHRTVPVKEMMTSVVVTVHPGQSIDECMALMTNHRVRHLPVIDGASVVGLISIGDVVKEIISEHEYTIKQLENYITGAR